MVLVLVAYLACSALAVPTYALALWRVLTLRLTGCGGAGVVEVKCVRQINTPKLPLGRFFCLFVCFWLLLVMVLMLLQSYSPLWYVVLAEGEWELKAS